MTREEVIQFGFEPVKHFTIAGSLIYDLGRDRHLSLGSVGTPNEILCICNTEGIEKNRITDIVVLHNYDYDGYLTKERLKALIEVLTTPNQQGE